MTGSTATPFLRPLYVSTAVIIAVAARPALAEVRTFDIPAQPAKTAIAVFAKQSGLQILASENLVRGKRTNAVTGSMEVDAALNQLLAGTGLVAMRPNDTSGIIIIKLAEPSATHPAAASGEANANTGLPGDIIVTARRQSETSMAAPVILTGISRKELERRNLTRMDDLNSVVPQLLIGEGVAIQGGSIFLRGVGGNANTTTADQGISFNIDGAQVARSTIRRIGQMDMTQIEVLKGPQGLFFGKNSPGGVISIRTADPTRQFEAKASALYEFVGREARLDGYVSGPLTDTLGVRVAVLASHMGGWEKNILPSTLPFANPRKRLPHDKELNGRLTLKFDPSDTFNARFKFNYGVLEGESPTESRQYVYCAFGTPQVPLAFSGENCKADNKISFTDFGSNFAAFGVSKPVLKQKQILSSLEMNYRPSDKLTVTSLSSLYSAKLDYVSNAFMTTDPARAIIGDYHPDIREISQEFRLASSFEGPINFLTGAYFQDSEFFYYTRELRNAANPFVSSRFSTDIDGSHKSVFGQLRVNPIETIELSGGGRYSWEKKRVTLKNLLLGTPPTILGPDWKNFSPELTAAWRPSREFTMFGSYKTGFLSGGYGGGPYDQQVTKGFEGGVKALLFGNRLRVNLSAYRYVSTGLQINVSNGTFQTITLNAGKGTVKGIEADFSWQTGIEGLTLRGAVGYNNARYNKYTTNCYPGQTIAAGCNLAPRPNGVFSLQDLAGMPFAVAPDWSGNGGVNYERDISDDWRLGLSADASYTSSYYTDTNDNPTSKHDGYWTLDANIRVTGKDDRWEAALLGRNLTNEHPYQGTFALFTTGGPSGTSGPTFDADRAGGVGRGRQLALQITRRFGAR